MSEEIIIDGVNVAGCCCYENDKCLWTKRYYENNIVPVCENVKDCYYKQLKRLEQENKELKKELHSLNCDGKCSKKKQMYKQALEEIRDIAGNIDDIDKWIEQNLMPSQVCERIEKINNKINEVLK